AKGSVHDFKLKELEGDEMINLSKYKGKKLVILNVASKCGFTKQYADWQEFNEKYGDKIVVLGFPANNFGSQEPGTAEDIAVVCQTNYGVTFPTSDRVDVEGVEQHFLFKWEASRSVSGWNDKAHTWCCCNDVVDAKGQLTHFFPRKIKPRDEAFKKAVGI